MHTQMIYVSFFGQGYCIIKIFGIFTVNRYRLQRAIIYASFLLFFRYFVINPCNLIHHCIRILFRQTIRFDHR